MFPISGDFFTIPMNDNPYSTDAKPRRRWFRFGLRTMFVVVTVISCVLAWSVHWVRERHAALRSGRVVSIPWSSPVDEIPFSKPVPPSIPPPGMLMLLGETGHYCISFTVGGDTPTAAEKVEIERLKRLFPEAEFFWKPPPWKVGTPGDRGMRADRAVKPGTWDGFQY